MDGMVNGLPLRFPPRICEGLQSFNPGTTQLEQEGGCVTLKDWKPKFYAVQLHVRTPGVEGGFLGTLLLESSESAAPLEKRRPQRQMIDAASLLGSASLVRPKNGGKGRKILWCQQVKSSLAQGGGHGSGRSRSIASFSLFHVVRASCGTTP